MKKVLVVDDELAICRLVKKNLEATGDFEVSFSTNSNECLRLAKDQRPDVILLDVAMPGLSGPEIAEQLQENEATKDIPYVFLTGIVTADEVHERQSIIGGRYFVAKPVKTPELIRVINLAVGMGHVGTGQ